MRQYLIGAVVAASVSLAGNVIHAADQQGKFRLLRLDGHHVKWGAPEPGTGASVKYAFVRDPLSFPDAINCRGLTSLDEVLTASGLTEAQLERETAAAFALWQGVANINFERTDSVETANILIGAASSPHRRRAHANVAYGSTGNGTTRTISKALVCLDPAQPWKVGFGGNADAYDMRYTLTHEIGHAIGLDHPSPSGELMSFSYAETFRVLQSGDIAGAALLYGSREAAKLAHANVSGQVPSPVQVPSALEVRGK